MVLTFNIRSSRIANLIIYERNHQADNQILRVRWHEPVCPQNQRRTQYSVSLIPLVMMRNEIEADRQS